MDTWRLPNAVITEPVPGSTDQRQTAIVARIVLMSRPNQLYGLGCSCARTRVTDRSPRAGPAYRQATGCDGQSFDAFGTVLISGYTRRNAARVRRSTGQGSGPPNIGCFRPPMYLRGVPSRHGLVPRSSDTLRRARDRGSQNRTRQTKGRSRRRSRATSPMDARRLQEAITCDHIGICAW